MSARTKPSVPSPRATPLHPMMLSPTASHFANNYNNNNYTRSQFYPTTSHDYPSYYGGTSAAFPYQRTDSQYPFSDYGRSGYGMTNAYYNPHNPYALGNTQVPIFGYNVPIEKGADYVIKHAAMGGGAALAAAAYGGASRLLFHHNGHVDGQHRGDGSP